MPKKQILFGFHLLRRRCCIRIFSEVFADIVSVFIKYEISESAALVLQVYAVSSARPNPHGASPSVFRKYSKVLGGVAVGAVSLLTVWIIISMMRREQGS